MLNVVSRWEGPFLLGIHKYLYAYFSLEISIFKNKNQKVVVLFWRISLIISHKSVLKPLVIQGNEEFCPF